MITNPPIGGSSPLSGPDPLRPKALARESSTPQVESFSTANAESLRTALAETPAIRTEVLAHAQTLAVDPSYPPLQIIERVAKMIAASQDPSATAD